MKTINTILLFLLFTAGAWWGLSYAGFVGKTACESTFSYKIGSVDARFGMPQEQFVAAVKKAEVVWEKSTGLDLFEYDPEATFAINLVFDGRQARTIAEQSNRMTLTNLEAEYSSLSSEHQALYREYQQKAGAFESSAKAYSRKIDAFNTTIASWNAKGGAPKHIFDQLELERKELEAEAGALERNRLELNALVRELNALGRQSNVVAQQYNEGVQTYKERFGGVHEFNQGEYTGDSIAIYQYDDVAELPLVLAHEMGHAIGLGHVENSASLMYYLMGDQSLDPITLTEEDVRALREVCGQ